MHLRSLSWWAQRISWQAGAALGGLRNADCTAGAGPHLCQFRCCKALLTSMCRFCGQHLVNDVTKFGQVALLHRWRLHCSAGLSPPTIASVRRSPLDSLQHGHQALRQRPQRPYQCFPWHHLRRGSAVSSWTAHMALIFFGVVHQFYRFSPAKDQGNDGGEMIQQSDSSDHQKHPKNKPSWPKTC